MDNLKKVIKRKFGYTDVEANNQIAEARQILQAYLDEDDQESAFNVCEECFGLEPDYLEELI